MPCQVTRSRDHVITVATEGQPVVFSGNQLLYFVDSKIGGQWVIIVLDNQLDSNDLWHVR